MGDLQLSIVVVSHNTRDALAECLESVRRFPPPRPHEVIVVDNASGDGSAQMVSERFPEARCMAFGENLGFAAGCNRGAVPARGKYLLLLNPDTLVPAGALEALMAYLDANPDVGALGPRQVDERGWPQRVWGREPTIVSEWGRRRDTLGLARGDEAARRRVEGRYREPADVDWVTGACLMMPRRLYGRLGGMDEAMWLYFEDVDLCRRVRRAGRRVVHHPGITILHRRGSAMAKARAVSAVAYRVSQLYYVRRHRGALAAAGLRTMFLARGLAGWVAWALGMAMEPAGWVSGRLLRLAAFGSAGRGWREGPRELDSGRA